MYPACMDSWRHLTGHRMQEHQMGLESDPTKALLLTPSTQVTHLLGPVGVHGCLWLQNVDRFCLHHRLGDLPDFLSNEVVNGVQSFCCALDQTHTLRGPCIGRERTREALYMELLGGGGGEVWLPGSLTPMYCASWSTLQYIPIG